MLRYLSQTLVRGLMLKKKIIVKIFCPPRPPPQKNFRAPFLP